jgi:uncharacterized membrane protein
MDYLTVKWLHVLASTVLFGTGIGSAFYLLLASLTGEPRPVAVVARIVVIADWLFTASTAIAQPLTGWGLVRQAGYPLLCCCKSGCGTWPSGQCMKALRSRTSIGPT